MSKVVLSVNKIPLLKDIKKDKLDVKTRLRTNPLPWKGQFSPQLVEVILSEFCDVEEIILDPFVGSGTVLYEALRRGIDSIGLEINPAAFILSNLYKLSRFSVKKRNYLLNSLERKLIDIINVITGVGEDNVLEGKFISLYEEILQCDEDLKEIFEAYIVLLDLGRKNILKRFWKVWNNIKKLVISLPYTETLVEVFLSDARKVPLKSDSVSFVLTSPPYVNVINYHQQYRKSVEFLGYKVLDIAKTEIGSNRKFRSNRFLTVIQYSLDMSLVFRELIRVCRTNSYLVFVVGRTSTINGVPIPNSNIILSIAASSGLVLEGRYERVYLNRYGQEILEDILVIRNSTEAKRKLRKKEEFFLEIGQYVASEILESCLENSRNSIVYSAIEDALSSIEVVKPSPWIEVGHVST